MSSVSTDTVTNLQLQVCDTEKMALLLDNYYQIL